MTEPKDVVRVAPHGLRIQRPPLPLPARPIDPYKPLEMLPGNVRSGYVYSHLDTPRDDVAVERLQPRPIPGRRPLVPTV